MLSARCNNHRFLNTSCTKFVPSFANQPNLNGPAHSLNRCNHRDRVIPRTKGSNHYFIASLMATAAISPGTAWRRAAPYAAASAQLPALIPFPPPAAVRPPAALTFALEASVAAPLHPMPPPRQPLPAPAISPCWHPVGAAPAPLPVLFPLLPLRRLRPRLLTPHCPEVPPAAGRQHCWRRRQWHRQRDWRPAAVPDRQPGMRQAAGQLRRQRDWRPAASPDRTWVTRQPAARLP